MNKEYSLRQRLKDELLFKGLKMENTPLYVLGFVFAVMGMSTLVMNHIVAQRVKVKTK